MDKAKGLTEELLLLTSQERAIRPYLNVFKIQWQQCKVLLKNTRHSALWKISEDVVRSQK